MQNSARQRRGLLYAFACASAMALAGAPANAALTISKKPTKNVTCSGGVCAATASRAVLNVNDLVGMLSAGDLKIVSGGSAQDILVVNAVTWASNSRPTLDAYRSISIEAATTVMGPGALTLTTNDGGSNGEYTIPARVRFFDLGSSFIVEGNAYTLVDDISTLASDIAANPSGFFALASAYDASADGTYDGSPIRTTFAGKFEGLGHQVSNLVVQENRPVALSACSRKRQSDR
jgi:hypothetical protein